jgi:hypothetical protein
MGTPAKAAGAVYAPRPGFAGLLGPRLQAGTIGLPLSDAERVRLHPYLTERILCRVPSLVRVASLAGAHYERLDGSGDSSVARSTVDHLASHRFARPRPGGASGPIGVVVGSLPEADVHVILVVGGTTTTVSHPSPAFPGPRDRPDPLVPDDVADVELFAVLLRELSDLVPLPGVGIHHEVGCKAPAVVATRRPVAVDRTDRVSVLDDSRRPRGVGAQSPGLSTSTASVSEPTHGYVDATSSRHGVRRGGWNGDDSAGDQESKGEGRGDPVGATMGTGPTVSTKASGQGTNPSNACEADCRGSAEKVPGRVKLCDYTSRSERLFQPRGLNPPLLP